MLSAEQIRQISRDAAAKAAKKKLEPFMVWEGDTDGFPPFPFPFIGDYRPPGWDLEQTYFVDSSGLGREDEPALTIRQFIRRIKAGYGYAILESGEFQVVVGRFRKVG